MRWKVLEGEKYVKIPPIITIVWDYGENVKSRQAFLKFALLIALVCAGWQQSVWSMRVHGLPDALGWVSAKSTHGTYGTCAGHFVPLHRVQGYLTQGAAHGNTRITAKGKVLFTKEGTTKLNKDVVLTQPGRVVEADHAQIFRGPRKKLQQITLWGHVRLIERGRLLIGQKLVMLFPAKALVMYQSAYQMASEPSSLTHRELHAWGEAKRIVRQHTGLLTLHHASYSVCSPINPTWTLQAQTFVIDHAAGRVHAKHVWLRIKRVPVFYWPSMSFSLHHQRKTGFLTPTVSYGKRFGVDLSQPFYWNMRPNMDMLLTPRYISQRGWVMGLLWRNLFSHTLGSLYVNGLWHDRLFDAFRADNLQKLAQDQRWRPYVQQLSHKTDHRYIISWSQSAHWGEHWRSDVYFNHVSDAYYFTDISQGLGSESNNQLLNQWDLINTQRHWHFKALLQGYQTLHAVTQIQSPVLDQYQKLPELDANGQYLNVWQHMDLGLKSQWVNFAYHSAFNPNQPIGQRLHVEPSLVFPWVFAAGHVTPSLNLDYAAYATNNLNLTQTQSAAWNYQPLVAHKERVVPITSIDTGLLALQKWSLGGHHFIETWAPRIKYLYVPYVNQAGIPNFDTYLLPFSYDQLFSSNRFAGFDRIDNADQLSFGLQTAMIDSDTGQQKWWAGVGIIRYFQSSQVALPQVLGMGESLASQAAWSPLVGQLTDYVLPNTSISANAAYDVSAHMMNNAGATLTYQSSYLRILSVGYQFIHEAGTTYVGTHAYSNSHSDLTLGVAWPLLGHWSTVDFMHYNLRFKRLEDNYAGLQFANCCWALRALVQRTYLGDVPVTGDLIQHTYQTRYVLQLQLKGLMHLGSSNPTSLFANTFASYQDTMSTSHGYRFSGY